MVVDAIAAGRRATIAIDKYLRGDTSRVDVHDRKAGVTAGAGVQELEETWEPKPRLAVQTLPLADRRTSFNEIELGFSEEIAIREAKRCLRCDLEV
jgi:NADH-quinone oxidoreductase subunit F